MIKKFKLPRPLLNPRMLKVAAKEVRRQKVVVLRANRFELQELAEITREIESRGLPKNLIRKKLPGGIGHGIFLHPKAEPILKGQIIAPYSGEMSIIPQSLAEDSLYAFEPLANILLTKEEQKYFDSKRPYHPKRLYAMYVDALKTGNFTRFINHSEKPNLVAEFYQIPSNSFGLAPSPIEVIYVAKKKIRPGEQLLVNYDGDEHSYWTSVGIKPVPITPTTFLLDASLKLNSQNH
jgi:hypothetical protein